MKRLFALAVLVAATTTPVVAEAQARPRYMQMDGAAQDQGRRQVPLSRVLSMIGSRYPGRHLNSTVGDAGGRLAYYVQWQMEDGRVVVFIVDAESGQIIGRQGG